MKICEGIQRMSIYEDDMESILLADYIDWKKLKEKNNCCYWCYRADRFNFNQDFIICE